MNLLLGTRNIGTYRIKTRLNLRECIGLFGVIAALRLDRRLSGAQIGERCLHGELFLSHRRIVHFGAAVEIAQTQGEQLGREASLLLFESLILACARCLALQVPNLLVDLVTQILQTFEVFTRIGDATLCFLAPLFVFGDSSGLFDERAHLVGFRLDHARDHALLDDRVTARPQTRTEK